jgi:hypothetical protein
MSTEKGKSEYILRLFEKVLANPTYPQPTNPTRVKRYGRLAARPSTWSEGSLRSAFQLGIRYGMARNQRAAFEKGIRFAKNREDK